jgi:Arc/MetJ-type ribon-helix-helix transcriptional regulator
MARAKIMVSIPEEMVADLDQAARQEHRSRSEFVREALVVTPQIILPNTLPNFSSYVV